MISRTEALALIDENITNRNLVKHMLAVEVVMKALSRRLGEDEELWGLTGLLHDLDYASTAENPSRHGFVSCEMLEGRLPGEALHAILSHPEQVAPQSRFDWALYCADPVTGLIVAAALMHPAKNLASLDLQFLQKRFKERRFAAGANREQMLKCSELGLSLDEFLNLALNAMKETASDLDL